MVWLQLLGGANGVCCEILGPSLRWDDGGFTPITVVPAKAGTQSIAPYTGRSALNTQQGRAYHRGKVKAQF
ncbi:hypothetical protein ACVW0Y_003737 [Pseudomonas sp. TE3786]